MRYHIPCAHETGEVKDTMVSVNDYHPLTQAEVLEMILAARQDGNLITPIQCRLNQGIVGLTCPHPIEDKVARKLADLNSLYIAQINSRWMRAETLAAKLYHTMIK